MTTTLADFAGWETGGGAAEIASQYNTTIVSLTNPNGKGSWARSLNSGPETGDSWFRSQTTSSGSSDWITVGFYVRFSGIGVNTDMDFFQFKGASGDGPKLNIYSADGDLRLQTSGGTTQDTYYDAFVDDTWYLIEVKYKSSASDIYVRVDRVPAVSDTSTGGGGNSLYAEWQGAGYNPSSLADVACKVACYYIYTDDGAAYTTNNTWLGRFSVLGPYQNTTHTTGVPDFGNNLNSGAWDDAGENPYNDSNSAEYTGVGTGGGGVSTDAGGRAGPYGDTDCNGTIKGAKWIWRYKKQGGSAQGFIGWYGSCPNSDPTTDYTTATASQTVTTSPLTYEVIDAAGGSYCPSKTDYFQYGFNKNNSGPAAADLLLLEAWCFILHSEPRRVNIDGSVQKWEQA